MNRFNTPAQGRPYDSEYDMPSDEIWDIQNRGISPIKTINNINLGIAGKMSVNEPGLGFVFYAIDLVTGKIYSEALINVYVNANDNSDVTRKFPAKPNRGFVGAFQSLYLEWAADTNSTYAINFVIFKSSEVPWMGGTEAQ